MQRLIFISLVIFFLCIVIYIIYRDELAIHVARAKIKKQNDDLGNLNDDVKKLMQENEALNKEIRDLKRYNEIMFSDKIKGL